MQGHGRIAITHRLVRKSRVDLHQTRILRARRFEVFPRRCEGPQVRQIFRRLHIYPTIVRFQRRGVPGRGLDARSAPAGPAAVAQIRRLGSHRPLPLFEVRHFAEDIHLEEIRRGFPKVCVVQLGEKHTVFRGLHPRRKLFPPSGAPGKCFASDAERRCLSRQLGDTVGHERGNHRASLETQVHMLEEIIAIVHKRRIPLVQPKVGVDNGDIRRG